MTINDIKSPFRPGIMITTPEKFWGRLYEKTTLISRLQNMGSSVIIGDRRIGKSSLAFYVFNYYSQNYSSDYAPIWIDCQSNFVKSLDGFFLQIKEKSTLNYSSGATEKDCLKNFEDAVNKATKKIILFIDEFEVITDLEYQNQFDLNFYMQLRMLAGRGDKLAIILVSKSPLAEICGHVLEISSPFYNIFTTVQLDKFPRKTVNEFLNAEHDNFRFLTFEKLFIKLVNNCRHPLVLQVASEAIFLNRYTKDRSVSLRKRIYEQTRNYLNHEKIETKRAKELKMAKKQSGSSQISKSMDTFLSIFIPVVGIGLLILEFGILFQYLDNFKATLLAVVSVLIGMVILIFAGRSINIISETSFFKLYTQIIKQIPLLSNLLKIDVKRQK